MLRFLLPVSLILLISLGLAIQAQIQRHRLNRLSWEQLLQRLKPVRSEGIALVAREHLQPVRDQIRLQPGEILELVGGFDGLAAMRQNTQILCALAAYAEQWNFDEAIIVTQKIRRDAIAVRRAVYWITLELFLHSGRATWVPFHLQEAAASYHLMKMRLLALYETSHAARQPGLAAVL